MDNEWLGGAVIFKYRIHDARLGRFLSVDPLAPDFPWNSNYAFAENRVIDGLELEGLEVILVNQESDDVIYHGAQSINDNTAIHIVTHGYYGGFLDGEGNWVTEKKRFLTVLKLSDQYQEGTAANEYVVVLHSCRTGRPASKNKNGQKPIAQVLSEQTGGTIIAPDERDYFNCTSETGPQKTTGTDENSEYKDNVDRSKQRSTGEYGNWMVYTEGVLVAVYSGERTPVGEPSLWDDFWYKKDLAFSIAVGENETSALRSAPGGKGESIAQLKKGTMLNPTGNVEDGYMEVTTENGETGWINADDTEAIY